MDNAAFRKSPETARLIGKTGATLLFLPPYSPDFNPIENSFGAIKRKCEFAPPDTPVIDIVKSSDCC